MNKKQVSALLTILGEEEEQTSPKTSQSTTAPYFIGKGYFIRTVTMHYTGRLVEVHDQELVIEEAAWIADSGRFSDALKSGDFSEVEPLEGRIVIGRGSIIDAIPYEGKLPREQK